MPSYTPPHLRHDALKRPQLPETGPRLAHSKTTRRGLRQDKLSPRQAAFLFLSQPSKLSHKQQRQLEQLRLQSDLSLPLQLALDFITILRRRQVERFDAWLQHVKDSHCKHLIAFANSLIQDYNAVFVALYSPFSNGPTEGHINKLKIIKRQMFGRAGPQLLAKRFLLAA